MKTSHITEGLVRIRDSLADEGQRDILAQAANKLQDMDRLLRAGLDAPLQGRALEEARRVLGEPAMSEASRPPDGAASKTPAETPAKGGGPQHRVECRRRPNGSAWISIGDPVMGPHFQCDFLGDVDAGPQCLADFAEKPPAWVKKHLGLTG